MNKTAQKNRLQIPPFQTGQVWQLADSHVEIGLIGKTLVHYKHYKGQMKRSPVSLLSKVALEKFLQENRAILVPALPTMATSR